MWAIWENKFYLVLSIIVTWTIIILWYETIIYIQTTRAITQFELNLVKINQNMN